MGDEHESDSRRGNRVILRNLVKADPCVSIKEQSRSHLYWRSRVWRSMSIGPGQKRGDRGMEFRWHEWVDSAQERGEGSVRGTNAEKGGKEPTRCVQKRYWVEGR